MTPKPTPLSLTTKLAYGTGDVGPAMVSMIKGLFLLNFLINVAGLSPGRAGWVLLLGKIWDAINDPIIGTLTDRTNTRWGRRRPWLLFGAIPFGLAFFLHFLVPNFSETGKFIYYVLIGILLDAGFTAVNVPYAALTPELSKNNQDRIDLNMYRFSFSVLSGLLAALMYNIIVNQIFSTNIPRGNAIQGLIVCALIILTNIIVFSYTTENKTDTHQEEKIPFFTGLKIALNSRPFRYVSSIYLLTWLSIQFVQTLLLFYFRDWVGGNPGGQFTLLLFGLQTSIFIFILIWGAASRKLGLKRIYFIGVPIWILVQIGLYFIQPGQITLAMLLAIAAGIGVSLGFLVPWSLLPSVIDHDELQTGQRREGIFYGFFVFLQKMGIAISLFVQGQILQWTGYISSTNGIIPTQPASALLALRILISLVPIAFLLLSLLMVYRNPINRQRLAEIQAELAARNAPT